MLYDKVKIFEQAKKAIVENRLIQVQEILAYVPCGKSTFYHFFPENSEELDILKELIETQKILIRVPMRKKWEESDRDALQIALMKMVASDEQRKKLSLSYHDDSNNEEKEIPAPIINVISNGTKFATSEDEVDV